MNESTSRKTSQEVFANVRLPLESAACVDIVVEGGRIAHIERHTREPEWMLFPPLVDIHVHANRAYTAAATAPTSLDHAIRTVDAIFREFGDAEYARQAGLLYAAALRRGTTRLRTHADVDHLTGLKSIRGTLHARGEFADRLEVEVVAFAGARYDPLREEVRGALREAVALGATLLGAVPAYYRNPRDSIDALLDLAVELEVDVDVHLDEHLDAGRSLSGHFAEAVRARGLHGRATLSHGCAMSGLDAEELERVIDALAQARITVVCLPTTNLYLQDRRDGAPRLRGLAPLRELVRAGVPLRFASDNVRDAFFPYGSADLLDAAHLIAIAGHIEDAGVLVRGICDGHDTVGVGDEASFVLVPGSTLTDTIAERPRERIVVRHGQAAVVSSGS